MTMVRLQPASQGISDALVLPVVLVFSIPTMPAGAGRFDVLHSAVLPANGWPHPSAANPSSVPHIERLEDRTLSSSLEVQDRLGERLTGPGAEQTPEALRARARGRTPDTIAKFDLLPVPEKAGLREL